MKTGPSKKELVNGCTQTNKEATLEIFWKELYREVGEYWERSKGVLPRTWDLKFGIFYSPVVHQPKLMIIGANPGFDEDDDTKSPPEKNLFYECPPTRRKQNWKITPMLQKIFGLAHQEVVLQQSVVTNLLFFKSRCLGYDTDRRSQGWRDNGDSKALREIEVYCKNKVDAIVHQVDPSGILLLGMQTWDKLRPDNKRNKNERLVVTGTVFSRPALGIKHPTGAWLSKVDCKKIAEHLDQFLSDERLDLG